ncbi:hypothetical protein CO251_15915 [Sulfobacillus sp. hq2]|nr:hypothetical protein CO251_15915 [Sulfobacillus sp. hq2]
MKYRGNTLIIGGLGVGLASLLLSGCGSTVATKAAPPPVTSSTSTFPQPHAVKASPRALLTPAALLAVAASTQRQEPVHLTTTITNTLGNANIQMVGATDPVDHESAFTMHATLSGVSGAAPVTIVTHIESIGSHDWEESTPPGGGWHTETVSQVNPSFPLEVLLPYIVNVHAVPSKAIDGHLTHGVRATLNAHGVRLLEEMGSAKAISASQQIIQSITFTLWVGPAHHPREVTVVEHCIQAGHPYEVFETIHYTQWGRGIHLSPPTTPA